MFIAGLNVNINHINNVNKTLPSELHRCDDLMLYFVVYDGISADEVTSETFLSASSFFCAAVSKILKLKFSETSQKDCVDITVALFYFSGPGDSIYRILVSRG